MRKLNRSEKNLLKTCHILSAGIWLSGVVTLAFIPVLSKDITIGDELYMYNRIYHFIDMYILTPAAIFTLITGFIYSVFTQWGFFKHGWLICKWALTLIIIITGTFYLGPLTTKMLAISDMERIGALKNPFYQSGLIINQWAAIINTLMLVLAVVMSVYKPWKNMKTGFKFNREP